MRPGFIQGLSGISVRKKLVIPVIIQAILVVVVSAVLLTGYRLLVETRSAAETVSQAMTELFRLGADLEGFMSGRVSWEKLSGDLSEVREVLVSSGNMKLAEDVSGLRLTLEDFSAARMVQAEIIAEVRQLTSKSRSLSNAYIVRVSERLADEEARKSVATIERSVIAGALKNTNNNFAIEDMFLSLERGDKTPDEANQLLEDTLANTRQDIILLAGTPFVSKAEAGLLVNLRLQQLLFDFQAGLVRSQETRALAVERHTTLMEDIEGLSKASLLGTLDSLRGGVWVLFAIIVATVGISLTISVLISVSITRPLAELRHHIDRLAESGGDLSFRLGIRRDDELGMLAKGVNHFLHSLQAIFSEVTESGKAMAELSRSVANVTATCSAQMTSQQEKTESVVTAAAVIDETVSQAREKTSNAALAVERSEARVTEVADNIRSTVEIIKIANIELENATSVIDRLNVDSQNIGGILDVIRGIADQTNLLALNAAIEAARAGEQGRGFAVVADEVRSLAQRAQSSIQEVDRMISNLQNASTLATTVVSSSAENIAGTLKSGEIAGEGVKIIADCMAEISQLNTEIASMMEAQSEKANGINQSVLEIRAIAGSNATAAKDASDSAQSQVTRANELVELMGRFRS
ncbi:MAG: methyl-accepting chemotaxis protein, partial [Thalassolituus sp.]